MTNYGYSLKFGLYIGIITFEIMLQIGITASDWDYNYRLRLGLQIGILNLEIQIGHWATYWNYKFRNKDDWDYSYRLRFGLQIGITATD